MDNNTEIIVSQDDAANAFEWLWNRLQAEDGKPFDVDINEALCVIAEGMNQLAAINEQHQRDMGVMKSLISDIRIQRDQALYDLQNAKQSGAREARRALELGLKYDFDIEPDAARALMDTIIEGNIPDDMPYSVYTSLRKAFEYFESEFTEAREQAAWRAADEGGNDGDDLS